MGFDYFYPEQAEQFAFFRIPKALFRDRQFKNISTDAKVLYGLIERKRQGLGKPTMIYVKNFSRERAEPEIQPDSQTHDFHDSQSHENHESRIMDPMNPDSRKSWSNKNESIKTDFNDTDPFPSSEEEQEGNGAEGRTEIENLLREHLMMDRLLQERPGDRDLLMEILQLLADTLCTHRKTIRLARDDKPAAEVRRQLLQLGPEHIRFVLDCMAENTTKIKNMRQYLLAALYNAPMTINSYYASLAQHDIASGRI